MHRHKQNCSFESTHTPTHTHTRLSNKDRSQQTSVTFPHLAFSLDLRVYIGAHQKDLIAANFRGGFSGISLNPTGRSCGTNERDVSERGNEPN